MGSERCGDPGQAAPAPTAGSLSGRWCSASPGRFIAPVCRLTGVPSPGSTTTGVPTSDQPYSTAARSDGTWIVPRLACADRSEPGPKQHDCHGASWMPTPVSLMLIMYWTIVVGYQLGDPGGHGETSWYGWARRSTRIGPTSVGVLGWPVVTGVERRTCFRSYAQSCWAWSETTMAFTGSPARSVWRIAAAALLASAAARLTVSRSLDSSSRAWRSRSAVSVSAGTEMEKAPSIARKAAAVASLRPAATASRPPARSSSSCPPLTAPAPCPAGAVVRAARAPSRVAMASAAVRSDGAVDPRLDGRGGHAEQPADLLVGEVQVEVEADHEALVDVEPLEGALQVDGEDVGVLGGGAIGPLGGLVDPEDAPPAAAQGAAALVGDDLQVPGPDAGALAELPEAAPGLERGLLHDVLRGGEVAEHAVGEPVRLVEQRPDQRLEGGVAPVAGFVDQRGGLVEDHHPVGRSRGVRGSGPCACTSTKAPTHPGGRAQTTTEPAGRQDRLLRCFFTSPALTPPPRGVAWRTDVPMSTAATDSPPNSLLTGP